jgi:Pyruvate/2-oxoacid:ferredoxin oxidoreductase delta subunit
LKTHGLTFMTGAIKNIFGVIPGRTKTGYHGTLTSRELFAGMLLDLAALAPPLLTIMDAVIGMEGEGPSGGRPRQIGLLMASDDPLALDIVASEIMGVPQERNPLLIEAKKRNMHPSSIEDVDVIGVAKERLRIEGFRLPSSLTKEGTRLSALFGPIAKAFFTVDPRIIKAECVACEACKNACPRGAIAVHRVAEIDKKKCIRCYCCHEMCGYNAIELHRSLFYRLLNKD